MKKLFDLMLKEFKKLGTKQVEPIEQDTIQNLFSNNILKMDAKVTLAYFKATR